MKNRNEELKVSLLRVAVLNALAALFAMPIAQAAEPAEDEVANILRPTNYVEIGAQNISRKSAKFGEYSGLNKADGYGIFNLELNGGDAYQKGGTYRWNVTGNDLGTTAPEIGLSVGNQGKWNIQFGYNELKHNLSDTYQTPYQGSMGGNVFTLSGFTSIPTAAPGTQSLTSAQLAAFHNVDISSTRKNTNLNASLELAPGWNIRLETNHLEQSGAKLMAFGSQLSSGANSNEKVAILPNPTNYKTDTVNLSLNWIGDKAHLSGAYFGSYFRDGYDRVTWQAFTGTQAVNTMTTPPSNDFHQFSLSGGYSLAPKTKLIGSLSYARNTQNDPFVDSGLMVTPAAVSSLNGLVVTTHGDFKLTSQTTKDLLLSATLKFDKRDNRTPSNIYNFNAISGAAAHIANYPNTPLSTKKTQVELAADYKLTKDQNLRFAINHDDMHRWCNSYAVNAGYPAGIGCVVATGQTDDKLSLTYRAKPSLDLNVNAGYSYAKRSNDYNPYARTAMIGTNGWLVAGQLVAGQNAGDYYGFHPYLDENRVQHIIKGGLQWQADDRLSLGINGKFTRDRYDTTYGWKFGGQWSLNLDASYQYSEQGSVSTFITQERRWRYRTDLRTATTVTNASATAINIPAWATDNGSLTDDDLSFGFSFKQAGLMKNKLELAGDLTYSVGRTDYGTTLNWAGLTTATAGVTYNCSAAFLLSCGDVPSVKNNMLEAKLTGTYTVDKNSKVALGYQFRRLRSSDYYYNGLLYGYTPTSLLPTNQVAPSYSVSAIAASYIYSF